MQIMQYHNFYFFLKKTGVEHHWCDLSNSKKYTWDENNIVSRYIYKEEHSDGTKGFVE
jgi:hypothetical protein